MTYWFNLDKKRDLVNDKNNIVGFIAGSNFNPLIPCLGLNVKIWLYKKRQGEVQCHFQIIILSYILMCSK